MAEKTIGSVCEQTLDQLIAFVQEGYLKRGTSASAGISQIEINGVWYEMQLRLERDEANFLGERDVVQTQVIGGTVTLS